MSSSKKMRDFCEITSSKRIFAYEYVGSGVPFYRSKEVIERQSGKLEVSTEIFISESRFEEIEQKFGAPQEDDLLLTSVGTLGVPYVVNKNERFYFKDGNLTWFRKFNGLSSRYLYYWFLSPIGKAELKKATIGSSQSAYTINLLNDLAIDPPDFELQLNVVNLLSNYDDLIETNRRRIALLEESARLLYREWFVNLRFPGHDFVRWHDGLPETWRETALSEVASIVMGQSPESKYFNNNEQGLPFHQGVSDFDDHFVCHRTYTIQATRTANAGDILCSVRAPVGRLNLTRENIAIGRGLSAMRSRNNHQGLLLYQLKALFIEEDIIGGGTIFSSVGKKELFSQQVLQPNPEIASEFDKFATQVLSQIEVLTIQNRLLAQTRDELLPKLMSGAIRV